MSSSYTPIAHRIGLLSKLHSHFKLLCAKKQIQSKLNQAWPEGRKSINQVMIDMKTLIWKHNCKWKFIIQEYFDEGLHRIDHPLEEYVLLMEWNRLRDVFDYTLYPEIVQKINNKIEYKKILQQHEYPVSSVLGMLKICDEKIVLEKTDGTFQSLTEVVNKTGGIFVKPDNMLQGKGCAKIQPTMHQDKYLLNNKEADEATIIKNIFHDNVSHTSQTVSKTNNALLTELLVENHPDIGAFHPASLNTLRIIIMRTPGGGVELNRAVMRFGAHGSSVDNLYAGGIGVPVDIKNGCLVAWGHALAADTPPYDRHPDTGILFEGFKIPYWKESLEMVLDIRKKLFPEVFNIGFDVAITPHGPVMIEANVSSCFFQRASAGGLRPLMNSWLRPLIEELQAGNPTIATHYLPKS